MLKPSSSTELSAALELFLNGVEPQAKNQAGRELIRLIFGPDSLSDDSCPSSVQ